jgi:ketosteroid isomerase-like protein
VSAGVDDTTRTVLAYVDALNTGDPDAIAATVTEDFRSEHICSLGHGLEGRAAYRERLPVFLGQFTRLRYEAEDLIVDGDRAAVPYRMSCVWIDDEGTGHPVSLRGLFRFRIRDGAIAHRVDYWDGTEFLRQVRANGKDQ